MRRRIATLALASGLLLGAPYIAGFMPAPIIEARPIQKPRSAEEVMAWAFPRQLHQIARRHGWDKAEERAWIAAWKAGLADWRDLTIAGALDGHRIDRVLKEKQAGDDNQKRQDMGLPIMATLAFGASFAPAANDANGYQTGWGATTTSPQTVGAGGQQAIIHALAPACRLIDDGESYVWGCQAYHPTGTTVRAALEGGDWETASARTYSATHDAWGYWFTLTTDNTLDSGRAEVRAEAIPVGDGESAILGAAAIDGSLAAGEEKAVATEERTEFIFNNGGDAHFARLYVYVDPTVDIAVGGGTQVALVDGDAVYGGTSTAFGFVEGDHAQGATSLRISVVSGTFQDAEALDKGTIDEVARTYTSASTNVGTTTSAAVARGANANGFVATTEADCVPDAEGGNLTAAATAASFSPVGGAKPFATPQAALVAAGQYRSAASVTGTGQTGLNAGATYLRSDGVVCLLGPSRNHAAGGYSVSGDRVWTDSAACEFTRASHVTTQAQCVIATGSTSGVRTRFTKFSNIRTVAIQLGTTALGYGPADGASSTHEPVIVCDTCTFVGEDNQDTNTGVDTDFDRIWLVSCSLTYRDKVGMYGSHIINCVAQHGADFVRERIRVAYGNTASDMSEAGAVHEDVFQIAGTTGAQGRIMHFANQGISNCASQMMFWRMQSNEGATNDIAVVGYLAYSTKAAENASVLRSQAHVDNVTIQACTIASEHPLNFTDDSSGTYTARTAADTLVRDCVLWSFTDTRTGTGTISLDNNHYIDIAVPAGDSNGTTGGTAAALWTTPGDAGDFHPLADSDLVGRGRSLSFEVDIAGTAGDADGSAIGVYEAVAPTITLVSPATASRGTSGTMTITGTGFVDGATVSVDAGLTLGSLTVNSSTEAECSYTATAAGTSTITITNPDGQADTIAVTVTSSVIGGSPTVMTMKVRQRRRRWE